MSSQLQVIESRVLALRDQFTSALTDSNIRFEAEAGFAVQAIMASKYSAEIALSNPQSVVNAVTNVAAIGISLNPAKKQAYLVPRDGKICLDVSYMGLMELAIASGSIRWAQAHLVHERDTFSVTGYDKPPAHTYAPFGGDRGGVVGVYVVAKTAEGDYLTHTMDVVSVFAIRDRSSAWKAWVEKKKSCPWVTDPGEMTKKTCVKQASKYWPKTDRLDQAIHHLNVDGGEGLAVLEAPAKTEEVDWNAKAAAAKDLDELGVISKAGAKLFKGRSDVEAYRSFAVAVQARGAQLRNPPKVDDVFVRDMDNAERNAHA